MGLSQGMQATVILLTAFPRVQPILKLLDLHFLPLQLMTDAIVPLSEITHFPSNKKNSIQLLTFIICLIISCHYYFFKLRDNTIIIQLLRGSGSLICEACAMLKNTSVQILVDCHHKKRRSQIQCRIWLRNTDSQNLVSVLFHTPIY